MIQIKSTDKNCYNCKYSLWMVGLGLGMRCGYPKKRVNGEIHPLVPNRFHTCELVELNKPT